MKEWGNNKLDFVQETDHCETICEYHLSIGICHFVKIIQQHPKNDTNLHASKYKHKYSECLWVWEHHSYLTLKSKWPTTCCGADLLLWSPGVILQWHVKGWYTHLALIAIGRSSISLEKKFIYTQIVIYMNLLIYLKVKVTERHFHLLSHSQESYKSQHEPDHTGATLGSPEGGWGLSTCSFGVRDALPGLLSVRSVRGGTTGMQRAGHTCCWLPRWLIATSQCQPHLQIVMRGFHTNWNTSQYLKKESMM